MNTRSLSSAEEVRRELLAGAGGLAEGARRVVRLRAVALWMTCILIAWGALLCLDALLRREEMGLRLLAAVTLLGTSLASAYRFLKPAWRFAPTSVEVAQWVERQQPELGERLSSVLQLAAIDPNEKRFGSRTFRDAAIRDWSQKGFQPAWDSYLNTGPWRRSVALLLAVVLALGLALATWPDASLLAAKRLAMPWSAQRWPRQDRLQLRDPPAAVALSSELQLEVVDLHPPLPSEVNFQVRNAGEDRASPTVIAATIIGDVAVASIPIVDRNVEVRAVGGDDDSMPWHGIDVVTPPQLENYQLIVSPPAYLGLATSEIVGKRIQVYSGSHIRCTGQLSEPVQELSLNRVSLAEQTGGYASPNSPVESNWLPELADDGRSFGMGGADGWEIVESFSWQLTVTTQAGLRIVLPDRWAIEVVDDAPPVVGFQEPLLLEVSSIAQLPIVGRANDDLGLESISLRYQAAPEQAKELVLWEWNAEAAGEPVSKLREWPIDAHLDLSREPALTESQQITVWIEAQDTLGQVGKSQVFTLKIRGAEDLIYAIQNRQQQVFERLRAIVDSQRRNTQLASRTAEIVSQSGSVLQENVDALTSVSQIQGSIRGQLLEGSASVLAEVEAMRALLHQNRLADSELARELDVLGQKIHRIAESSLPEAMDEAYAAREQASQALASEADSGLQASLQRLSLTQTQVLDDLQSLLDRMARNEATQQLQRELVQIANQQVQLKDETNALHLQDVSGIDKQQLKTQSAGLNADQQSLARQLDSLITRARELGQAEDELAATQQVPIRRMADALIETQASSLMRRGAEEIASGQFSAAASTQEQASAALQRALSSLGMSNAATNSLAGQAEQLRQTSQQLSALADQQSELAEEMHANPNAAEMERWEQQQNDLQQDTADQAQQLEESGNSRSAQAVENAVESQRAASRALQENQSLAAASQAKEAAEQLADAAQDLQERADNLDQEARQEQISQLAPTLAGLLAQQEPIVEHLELLAQGLRGQQPDLDVEEVRGIAAQQEGVRQDLRDVRDMASQLPAFNWTLEQIEEDMSRAVAAAQRMRVDPDALDAAKAAMTKLRLAATALEPVDQPKEAPASEEPNGSENANSENQPLPPIASLKLLRGLQQDINARTKLSELSEATAGRERILDALAKEQQTLGKQLEQLLRELAASNDTNQ